MHCTRLDHFVRFNPNGTVSRCGHMADAPQFANLADMDGSAWLQDIRQQFDRDEWPAECVRCQDTEAINGTSIRLNSLEDHEQRTRDDYLQVAGVLDNICNSACQFCDETLSTKIGSLKLPREYVIYDNSSGFDSLPQERITWLDISGGEPSASKNYKRLLDNLPPNLEYLRVNTNASLLLPQLERINQSGVRVTVTISFDGVGRVHDYNRWPIAWEAFLSNVEAYECYNLYDLNFWTTVNALNIMDLDNILAFMAERDRHHSWSLLDWPPALNIKYSNSFTRAARDKYSTSTNPELRNLAEFTASGPDNQAQLDEYIQQADLVRGICINDYLAKDYLK
jgi:sulfatase maturation enzyme AslB (radical SAM superfamily)